MKLKFLGLSFFLFFGSFVNLSAAPGDFDTTFGTNGQAINTIPGAYADVVPAIQADGKIVIGTSFVNAASNLDFAVMRLNANGTADTDFGTNGRVVIPFDDFFDEQVTAIAIQPDGKIVVVGHVQLGSPGYDFGVARLNTDGSLDTTFNGTGKLKIPVSNSNDFPFDVAVQTDGKIVVAGKGFNQPNSDGEFVRINTNGTLDTGFNGTGKLFVPIGSNDSINEIVIQSDGKIVGAGTNGSDFAVVRVNTNGTLDTTFNGTGVVTTPVGTQIDEAFSVALQSDGKILAAGSANSGSGNMSAIVRYNTNGSVDTSYNGDGKTIMVFPASSFSSWHKSVLVQSDDKVIGVAIGGGFFNLVRYYPNGQLDTTFGTNGVKSLSVAGQSGPTKAVLQPDGKIVASGLASTGFAVARFLTGFGKPVFDFDGDGKTDVSIYRPSNGEWWYSRSSDTQVRAAQFGSLTDKPVPADFTGDGKTDIAFYRPSTGEWFILRSEDASFLSFPFGNSNDIPAVGDFDADGKADPAVFRPSTGEWFILKSSGGTIITTFGTSGDVPVAADYDGDGKTDVAIFRPSDGSWWHIRSSDNQFRVYSFGVGTDKPVQGDWTGDGKADIAVYRPSTGVWYFQRSEDNSFYSVPFGTIGDIAAPGDYDGDGKFDTAVFRPSNATWYVQRSNAGLMIQQFGLAMDKPIPSAFIP